jgi:hypothetical protein
VDCEFPLDEEAIIDDTGKAQDGRMSHVQSDIPSKSDNV